MKRKDKKGGGGGWGKDKNRFKHYLIKKNTI